MIALPIPGRAGLIVGPAPTLCQLVGFGIHIVGHKLVTGVNASSEEDARLATVQVRCTEEMLGRTMAVAVTPGRIEVCLAVLKPLQRIIHRDVWHTCSAVHVDQVFCTIVHKPVRAATCGTTVVFRSIANHVCLTVGRMDRGTVGRTHDGLGLTVEVPVVGHDILFVILEVTHIGSAVHPPQHGTIEFQALKDAVLAVVTIPWEAGVDFALVVIFQENLQFTVAINICATGIIGNKCGGYGFIMLGRNLQIAIGPRGNSRTLRLLHTALHRLNGITV